MPPPNRISTSYRTALVAAAAATACFHAAFVFPCCAFLIAAFLFCLLPLTNLKSKRITFYGGILLGLALYAPQLAFFHGIFGLAALLLWLVPSVWLALFLLISRLCRSTCRPIVAAILIPFFWTAIEYFRGELYYLRFSWLSAGYAFSPSSLLPYLAPLGLYGIGLLLMLLCSMITLLPRRPAILVGAALLLTLAVSTNLRARPAPPSSQSQVHIAVIQLEFPGQFDVLTALNRLILQHPQAQLLMLSEYTFNGPVPQRIRDWCRQNNRYLVAGGKDPAPNGQFYNTAFVVDPDGQIVFRQAKCVPIQFFKDGLPAPHQSLWISPWGRIGLCVCYDLSYTRVTDELARQGAQAILVPTMDVTDWGRYEHDLHALVAPMRAAEYRVPVVRACSSGISQAVAANGQVIASAPYPGRNATFSASIAIEHPARRPLDRLLSPAGLVLTIAFVLLLPILHRRACLAPAP